MINLIQRAERVPGKVAVKSNGKDFTYGHLLNHSKEIALAILGIKEDLHEERVAFLVDPGFDYVAIQWGIWRAGGIAVPLCIKHPLPSIEYVLIDSSASTVIYSRKYRELLSPLLEKMDVNWIDIDDIKKQEGSLPDISIDRKAMILYTSGTTSKPKGVVSSHFNIEAQIKSLVKSWHWNENDHILNVLPLHHVHGIVNILCCALWSGATCEFLPRFDEEEVFRIFGKGEVNVFMAVPTIYYKLITYWNDLAPDAKQKISQSLKDFRLMVSGSAALPVSVLEKWRAISGHTLLERYGMTEIGMAISNPYHGERKPGYIGLPLEGVSIRLADENNNPIVEGTPGEIQIKGDNVFKEYWNKPEATEKAFTEDGWFLSGDVAVLENGSYRILGRNSVDIIKSGGYKISALEIEEILRSHPGIKECGVVGIPDEEWGEIIGASLILSDHDIDLCSLSDWLKDKLPAYKIPRKFIIQKDLPRNVMGKVTKNELKKCF